ncbi:MAG: hypothetical protein RIS35_3373 [Pseudomonadota bacterium]|jgi:hypothetical protein
MNEQQFGEQVRRMLEESSEHLPFRVTHKLESARLAALARMPAETELAPAGATPAGALDLGSGSLPRWSRLAAVLSLMLLIGGLVGLSIWSDLEMADETADVEMAVLTDDEVPISGYADRGFGVFMKNSRQ